MNFLKTLRPPQNVLSLGFFITMLISLSVMISFIFFNVNSMSTTILRIIYFSSIVAGSTLSMTSGLKINLANNLNKIVVHVLIASLIAGFMPALVSSLTAGIVAGFGSALSIGLVTCLRYLSTH